MGSSFREARTQPTGSLMNSRPTLHNFNRAKRRALRQRRFGGKDLDAFFTSAPVGLAVLDSQLHILKANDTMAEMIGIPIGEMIGRTPREVVPQLAPIIDPILSKVCSSGKPALNFPINGETPREPGVMRNWIASAFPIVRERNRKWSIGAIAVEVSDHEQFETVRKSEALLAEAEQIGNSGSWEHDLASGSMRWSANLCRMLGTDPTSASIPEEFFGGLIAPEDRETVHRTIDGAMKNRQPHEYQAQFILPDGRKRVFLIRGKPIVDSSNRVIKRIGVVLDVTDRVESARALRESEERYRDLVEHSHDLICTHDLDGRVLSMNELPARILGYRAQDLIGHRIPEMLIPEVRHQFKEYIERIQRDGYAKGLMVLTTRSGEQRIWEYQNTLRTDGVPKPIVRGMAHDITERKRAQDMSRQLSARLLQLQDEERRRIARELHESTAQDLAGLRMSLGQLMRMKRGLSAPARSIIEHLLSASDHMVQEIRTLSYTLHPPFLEETGLATAVAWYARGFSERSGIKVQVEVADDLGRLPPELETTLFRILQECLTNIHWHSGSPWARIRVVREHNQVSMEVADGGRGFRKDESNNVPTAIHLGVGIAGMSERVKQLKGAFNIESAPTEGVTVHVTLPIPADAPRAQSAKMK
jgi:PAS domain S-box-containing protein